MIKLLAAIIRYINARAWHWEESAKHEAVQAEKTKHEIKDDGDGWKESA